MNPIRTLEGRLVVTIAVWTLVAVTAVAWLIGDHAAAVSRRSLDQRLSGAADQIARGAEVGADGILSLARQPDEPGFFRPRSGWYWTLVAGEASIAASRSVPPEAAPAWWKAARESGRGPLGEEVAALARPVRRAGGGEALLVVTAPLAEVRAEARAIRTTIFQLMAALAALLLLGVMVQVRLGLRPVRRLAAHIEEIRAGRRREVPPPGIADLEPVADAINRLTASLSRLAERSRAEAANLAHAIKTPLSVILLRAGGPPAEDALIAASARQIERQVDRRLRRSPTAGADGLALAATPIAPVVADAVLAAGHGRGRTGLVPELDVPAGLAAPLARADLEEVLGNVVDNAYAWARSQVRISACDADGAVTIRIEDDGPGIDEAKIPAVLARGGRLDESMPGTGLGLAIVGDIVADAGGRLGLGRSPLGGLALTVVLPRPCPIGHCSRGGAAL